MGGGCGLLARRGATVGFADCVLRLVRLSQSGGTIVLYYAILSLSLGFVVPIKRILLMQHFYSLTPSQRINIALDAERMRRSPKHQQTLINLRLLASLI